MCGLAGYVGSRTIDDEVVRRTLDAMHHRGPDARGAYHHEAVPGRHVYLLHTRLAIIDRDPRADQPLRVGPGVIAANAELYNYLELRGPRACRTASDTEVLCASLLDRGVDALDECEGMWALAFYREDTGALVLGRDRFGEKPLYLLETPDGLYFASETRAIWALAGRRAPLSADHLRRYLVNGYKSLYKDGQTFFEGLGELPPATALTIEARGGRCGERYWQPRFAPDEAIGPAAAAERVRDALKRSVELRLRADRPVAFMLSGGVDSNALAALAARELGRDVHAFTIVNRDARYDERAQVEASVRELGIRHTEIPVATGGFIDGLRDLVRRRDAPLCTITWYAHALLMRAVAEHGYAISVSGTGADELFSGYYDHHQAYMSQVRADPVHHEPALAAWNRHVRPIVRNPHLADSGLFVKDPGFRGHVYLDAGVFAGYLVEPWHEPFAETRYTGDLLRNRMLNELLHEAVPPMLHDDDHNAMAHSIENRSPFLDRALVELAYSIPTRHLMRDGYTKVVLRDAMRGVVPDVILDERRKVGFNVPIADFLDLRAPDTRAALLDESPIFDLVRRDAIEGLLAQEHLPNSRSKFLFSFLCAKLFLEQCAACRPEPVPCSESGYPG